MNSSFKKFWEIYEHSLAANRDGDFDLGDDLVAQLDQLWPRMSHAEQMMFDEAVEARVNNPQ